MSYIHMYVCMHVDAVLVWCSVMVRGGVLCCVVMVWCVELVRGGVLCCVVMV